MKMQFGSPEKWNPGFKVPLSLEEVEAARIAAGKALEEARKIEEVEKPKREQEAAALERIKQRLSEETVHVILEEKTKDKEIKKPILH